MNKHSRAVFVIIILSLVVLSGCEKPTELQLRFDQSQTLNYVHRIDMKIDTQALQMPMNFTISMAIYFDEKALQPLEDGYNRIENTITRTVMDFDLGIMSFKADSANPGTGQQEFQKIVDSIAGLKFTQVMDDKGNVKRVEGVEQLAKVFGGGAAGGAGAQVYEQLMESMSNTYYFPLPDKPVKIGESWKAKPRDTDLGMLGKIQYEETLTLQSIENNVAYITSEPVLKGDLFSGGSAAGMPPGMSMKFEEVKMKAEYYFDMDMGRMRRQVIHMDMKVQATGGPTGNIPMQFKTIQETVMENQ